MVFLNQMKCSCFNFYKNFKKIMNNNLINYFLKNMGNQLIKNYDIVKEPTYAGGHKQLWQIYCGTKQDKSKQKVSIFQLDKKKLDKKLQNKEEALSLLRKECSVLMRFKHPQCLSIIEPLMEDPSTMAFVTEPILYPLSELLNKTQSYCELSLKLCILDMVSALQFFHSQSKLMHLNISPNSIFVTPQQKWKLGGMQFSQTLQDPYIQPINGLEKDPNFVAPELLSSKPSEKSDVFSLGKVVELLVKNSNELVRGMCQKNENQRYSLEQVANHAWLNDNFVVTIRCLENILQMSQPQQVSLLKGLQNIITQFDFQIIKDRILPTLTSCIRIETLSHLVIQIYVVLLENFKKQIDFKQDIFPHLKSLIHGKEMSAQALYLIINKIEAFNELLTKQEMQDHFLPLFIKSYDCGVAKLQIQAIQKTSVRNYIQELVKIMDYIQVKNTILPRIVKLCLDGSKDIKKHSLLLLKNILPSLDKTIVADSILPMLDNIRQLPMDQEINLILLELFRNVCKTIDIDVIGNKLLPSLIPYLMRLELSKQEFTAYLEIAKQLIKKIEEDRIDKLSNSRQNDMDINKLEQNYLKEASLNQDNIKQSINDGPKQKVENDDIFLGFTPQNDFGNLQQASQVSIIQQNSNLDFFETTQKSQIFQKAKKNEKGMQIKEQNIQDLDFDFPSTVRRVPEPFLPFNFNDSSDNSSFNARQPKQQSIPIVQNENNIQFQNQNIFQQINIMNQTSKSNPWEQDFELDDPLVQQLVAIKDNKKGVKQLIINKQKKNEGYDLI